MGHWFYAESIKFASVLNFLFKGLHGMLPMSLSACIPTRMRSSDSLHSFPRTYHDRYTEREIRKTISEALCRAQPVCHRRITNEQRYYCEYFLLFPLIKWKLFLPFLSTSLLLCTFQKLFQKLFSHRVYDKLLSTFITLHVFAAHFHETQPSASRPFW